MNALPSRRLAIPRSLKLFWAAIGGIFLVAVLWLQHLGPPAPVQKLAARPKHGIPPPSPVLLATASVNPLWQIPHPGPYGVTPMQYYAAVKPPATDQPRIAILVGGIGYALAPGLAAVRHLPPQVSLALTPYGAHIQVLATAARMAGHETLMGLPMQVDHQPDVTAGDQAMQVTSLPADNHKRLDWALSRAQGYAGAADVIGLAAPETFLSHRHAATWLAGHLAHDGLFLVVADQNAAPPADADVRIANGIIDPAQGAGAEKAALRQLRTVALARGSALGVLLAPTRRSIAILAAWCKTLSGHSITLVPVSALADSTQ